MKKRPYRRRGLSTPVGLTINQLAVSLKADDKTLSLDDAKKKAKNLVKANKTLQHAAGVKSFTLIEKLFGNMMGRQITKLMTSKKKESEAVDLLADYEDKKTKSERIPDSEFKEIMKRLDNLDAKIESIKIVKVAAPEKTQSRAKRVGEESKEMQGAREALADPYFGFSKETIEQRLADAPEGATEADLIQHALKDPSKKIPKQEVPVAVEEAKEQVATGPLEVSETKAPEITKSTPIPSSAISENAKVGDERDQRRKSESESLFRKSLMSELDDIQKTVKQGSWGILDWLILAFAAGGLVYKVLEELWNKYTKPIHEFFKNIHDWLQHNVADPLNRISDFLHLGHGTKEEAEASMKKQKGIASSKEDAVKNNQLEWYDVDKKGKTFVHMVQPTDRPDHKKDALEQAGVKPLNVLDFLSGNKSSKMLEQSQSIDKAGAAKDKAPVINIVSPVKSSPTVVTQKSPQSAPVVSLKLRNDESSVGSLVSDHFYHPVTNSRNGM